jgi:hypothetical protein
MTKYRYASEYKAVEYFCHYENNFWGMEDKIKSAIKLAMEYPYCLNPLSVNIWNLEELKRYDKRIKEKRRLIGSYLK